jgi:hypothetical protein
MKKEILLLGEILAILVSTGAIVWFFESLLDNSLITAGGGIVLISAVFMLLSIYVLLKK